MKNPNSIRVLIAEDDQELLELLISQLEVFKFQVLSATSGNKAKALLERHNDIDIVVSDIRMEDGTGVDLVKFIKARNPSQPRVFLISGFSDFSFYELYDYGIDGFFSKPLSAAEIRSSIQKSFVDQQLVWSKSLPEQNYLIEKTIPSLENSSELRFGRGGFYLHITENFPKRGELCNFNLVVEDQNPCMNIKGIGDVLWVREKEEKGLPPGIGIEIQSLEVECLKSLIEYIKATSKIPYIPKS